MSRAPRLAALLLVLGGCVSTPPTIGDPAPTLEDSEAERAYQEALARYSDRAELYSGFDTILFAGATLQTPAFREVRVRRMASFQRLAQERVEALVAQESTEAERAHEFFLGVHVNNYRHEDFDRATSIWNVVLVTPTAELQPTRIERIGRVDLDMRAYYPYLGTFWVGYRLRFPTTLPDGTPVIPPEAEQVTLRLASSLGRVEMRVGAR